MWQQSQDPNAGLPVQGPCFFQGTRLRGPGRISLGNSATTPTPFLGGNCLSRSPQTLLFGKISVSCQFGTVYPSGLRASKRPEIQGEPSKSRVKATVSRPLSVRPQPSCVPLGKRLRHSSELVRITSLGTGRTSGSSDGVSLLTWTGALIILMRRNWNLGKAARESLALPEASEWLTGCVVGGRSPPGAVCPLS